MSSSRYYACNACGYQFTLAEGEKPVDQREACPECGGVMREVGVRLGQAVEASAVAHDATVVVTENADEPPHDPKV